MFAGMFRLLLLAPAMVLCANACGQYPVGFCPPALNALEHWSDSLYQRFTAPPRYLAFLGEPTDVTIHTYKVRSERATPFNSNRPFEGLELDAGTRTIFRFDDKGRLTSCRKTESFGDGTETLSYLDSMEYGPDGLDRMIHGPDYLEVTKYGWAGGRIASKELIKNGFVVGRTTWSYDDSQMTIDSEQSSALDPNVRRTHWTLLARNRVASMEITYGKDTSRTDYRYFNDSLCTLNWSNDTNEFKGPEPVWVHARARRLLSNGELMETQYYNDDRGIFLTEVYINGKLTRISRYCDEGAIVYNDRGDPLRQSMVFGCEELPDINQTLRFQFFYQYDAIGNLTEVLYMNGLDRFNAWPNDWPSEISLWRFEYEYR